jgi:hypothetical protein
MIPGQQFVVSLNCLSGIINLVHHLLVYRHFFVHCGLNLGVCDV